MRSARGDSAFSLIEVVLIIVIIGLSFSGLSVVLSNTTMGNMDLDFGTTAVFLARGTMVETKAKNFGDIADEPSTDYEDDDDDVLSKYSYEVTMNYVDPANLDTPVVGPTEYKRIVVTVTRTDWAGSIVLTNLKTDVE